MAWQPSWNRRDQSSGWRDSYPQQGYWQNRYEDYTSEDKSKPLFDSSDPHLPSSFTPDEQHLDTSQPVPLYRYVQATAWSRNTGIAGLPIHQVPLSAITRMGLQEWALRPLSQGRYTGVILTRSVAESVMCARFLHHLRAKQWDVDSMAEKVFKEQFPETPVPDKHQQAKEFIDPLSQKMLQALEAYATPRQGDKNVEVQDLKEKAF